MKENQKGAHSPISQLREATRRLPVSRCFGERDCSPSVLQLASNFAASMCGGGRARDSVFADILMGSREREKENFNILTF